MTDLLLGCQVLEQHTRPDLARSLFWRVSASVLVYRTLPLGPALYGVEWTRCQLRDPESMWCFATFICSKWPFPMVPKSSDIFINLCWYLAYSPGTFTSFFKSNFDPSSSALLTFPCRSLCAPWDAGYFFSWIVFTSLKAWYFTPKSPIICWIMELRCLHATAILFPLRTLFVTLLKFKKRRKTVVVK